ncbi:MAG: hypothetical protein ACPHL6_10775, partial [Rubripirellula sp.]
GSMTPTINFYGKKSADINFHCRNKKVDPDHDSMAQPHARWMWMSRSHHHAMRYDAEETLSLISVRREDLTSHHR